MQLLLWVSARGAKKVNEVMYVMMPLCKYIIQVLQMNCLLLKNEQILKPLSVFSDH